MNEVLASVSRCFYVVKLWKLGKHEPTVTRISRSNGIAEKFTTQAAPRIFGCAPIFFRRLRHILFSAGGSG